MANDSGLEGVIVADTELSSVDGEAGRLVLRGCSLEEVAGVRRFGELAGLLWTGRWPAPGSIARTLGEGRAWVWARRSRWWPALDAADGMDALRAGLARLDEDATDPVEQGARLAGAVAVIGAAWGLARRGSEPLAPDASADHAADLLRMARGRDASPDEADALDRYLVTVIDHGLNASTFAARVVTSTGSDAVSALVAAIGALKGPLHGGAPGPVLDMLDAIGRAERAPAWLRGELDAGRRIMGMGHRVYRARDPRAAVLEKAVEALDRHGGERLALARSVEREAEAILRERHPVRALRCNVEFYTAILLEALGLDRAQLTPTFAAGRAAGWWGHVLEQRARGRLIRPSARYVGPLVAAPG
ncbi:MAG: citrate synthase [Sandaracinaceae bacterium]|nr:citrate synthase [Sandaracinaceae bacterium]